MRCDPCVYVTMTLDPNGDVQCYTMGFFDEEMILQQQVSEYPAPRALPVDVLDVVCDWAATAMWDHYKP